MGWWSSNAAGAKGMVEYAAAEKDGRCQYNTTRGCDARARRRGRAGREDVREDKHELGTYLEGERRRVCEYECWQAWRGFGVVDLLTARREGSAAGPMEEVESEGSQD